MRLTFLGTGAAAPSRTRNVTSIALQFDQRSPFWLFDCGEGTQHQILRSPFSVSRIERIFITHLHGDHLFGLLGLLASRSLQEGSNAPVTLYGPEGLSDYYACTMKACGMHLRYPVIVETVQPGQILEESEYTVTAVPLHHRIPCFGYVIQEKERPGHFDAAAARAFGVPEGPLFGRLKSGETIVMPDGRRLDGKAIVGPPRPGRKVVLFGDTTPVVHPEAFAGNANLIVHEATYLEEDLALARRALHSTAAQAARIARDCKVGALILTHVSPRYDSQSSSRLPELLAEARIIFPNTYLAEDFWSYSVPSASFERQWTAEMG
jgi:ribonuclease Z